SGIRSSRSRSGRRRGRLARIVRGDPRGDRGDGQGGHPRMKLASVSGHLATRSEGGHYFRLTPVCATTGETLQAPNPEAREQVVEFKSAYDIRRRILGLPRGQRRCSHGAPSVLIDLVTQSADVRRGFHGAPD